MSKNQIERFRPVHAELIKFFFVGITTVLIDLSVYMLLSIYWMPSVSKALSFVAGCLFAYFANKYFTFAKQGNQLQDSLRFASLYMITLGLNTAVNSLILFLWSEKLFAFIVATGCSTVANFIGMKCWVFKSSEKSILDLFQFNAAVNGPRPWYNQGLGGNISVKKNERELLIKPSGLRLHALQSEADLAHVDLQSIKSSLEKLKFENLPDSDKEVQYSQIIQDSRFGKSEKRASMEVGFHAFLPKKYVLHFHHLNSLVLFERAQEVQDVRFRRFIETHVEFYNYEKPGWKLTEAFISRPSLKNFLVLENHGLIFQADTTSELSLLDEYEELLSSFIRDLGVSLSELQKIENLHALSAPLNFYFPDIAILENKIRSILEEVSPGVFTALPNAAKLSVDAYENWLAIVYLYHLKLNLKCLPSSDAVALRELPTEIARMKNSRSPS